MSSRFLKCRNPFGFKLLKVWFYFKVNIYRCNINHSLEAQPQLKLNSTKIEHRLYGTTLERKYITYYQLYPCNERNITQTTILVNRK